MYFLVIGCLQLDVFFPGLSPTHWSTTIGPLVVVLTINAVKEAYEALKSDPSKCIILGDYKQKLLPSQHRESSVEHYGKRGISYHSFLCAYMEGDEMKLRYFDSVVEGDATQDIGMTLSICEEALFRMRAVVPSTVTSFTFQSDNARTYQNLCLPLLLPELAESAKWLCARLPGPGGAWGRCVGPRVCGGP